jgi:peroxin-16
MVTAPSSVLPTRGNARLPALPPKWLRKYDDFVTKNAHQVSQIESTLRSLTYIIPGKFLHSKAILEMLFLN